MAQNAQIVTLKSPDGTPIVPRTDAKAIGYGNATLGDALDTLEHSKQDKINESQEKESVDDADLFPISDSTESNKTKNITFNRIKANIKEYSDTLYNKTVIVNNLGASSEGSALDAVQGRILDDKITACDAKLSTVCIPAISSGTGAALTTSLPGRNLIDRLAIRLRLHEDVQQGATLDFNETGVKPILHANKEPISAWAKAGASIHIEYNDSDGVWYLLDNAVIDTQQPLPEQVIHYAKDANIKALFHFDGNFRDSVGCNIVSKGSTMGIITDSKFGYGAMNGDGTANARTTVPINPGGNDFTFDFWVKPLGQKNTNFKHEPLLVWRPQVGNALWIGIDYTSGCSIRLSLEKISKEIFSDNIEMKKWSHIEISKQATLYRIFVNGKLSVTMNANYAITGSLLLGIGTNLDPAAPENQLYSPMDELRYCDKCKHTIDFTPLNYPYPWKYEITDIDDYSQVLSAADITATYANSAALVADTSAMVAILDSEYALRILTLTCTGDLMYAILNSSDWITAIKANETARRIIMSNPHWAKFIAVIPTAEPLLNYTFLYEQGDECESKTGGWDVSWFPQQGSKLLKNHYSVQMDVNPTSGWSNGNVYSKNKVSLVEYVQAIFDCGYYKTGTHYNLGPSFGSNPGDDSYLDMVGIRHMYGPENTYPNIKDIVDVNLRCIDTIDISQLTTPMYCKIHGGSTTAGSSTADVYVYHIALLKSDPYQPWLNAAGITKSFANLDAVLADTDTLALLMSNEAAVEYMISCSGTLMAAVCQSQTAMTALCNNIAYDKAFDNPWWYKFMTMCPTSLEAMDAIAKTVPTMVDYTHPSGEVFESGHYQVRYGYRAFDRNLDKTTNESRWVQESTYGFLGYKFEQFINVYKAIYINEGTYNAKEIDIQYSDDGVTYNTVKSFIGVDNNSEASTITLPNAGFHRYWRFKINSAYRNDIGCLEAQFYGKAVT